MGHIFRVLCREPSDDHPSTVSEVIDAESYDAVEGWSDLMVASEVTVTRNFGAGSISVSCSAVEANRSVVSNVWPRDFNRDVVFLDRHEDDGIVIACYLSEACVFLDGYGGRITFKGKNSGGLARGDLTDPSVDSESIEFVSAARALIGHRVKIEMEDPQRSGMAIGRVGRVADVADGVIYFEYDHTNYLLSDIYKIEVKNDDFKTMAVRDMELVSDAMQRRTTREERR